MVTHSTVVMTVTVLSFVSPGWVPAMRGDSILPGYLSYVMYAMAILMTIKSCNSNMSAPSTDADAEPVGDWMGYKFNK